MFPSFAHTHALTLAQLRAYVSQENFREAILELEGALYSEKKILEW